MVSPSTMVQTPHDSVSKGSTPRSQWRIRPGSYIAFSLDVRSIAEKFTAGSPAYEEVMQMQSKKYVGLVVSSYTYSLDDDSREDDVIEELVVNFVGNSPPSEEGLIKHSMPIAPSTYSSLSPPGPLTTSPRNVSDTQSPLSQSPLQTTTLFPWKNRVQWTTSGTRIIVRKFHESKLNFYLDDEEFERFEQKVLEDYATIPTFHTSSCATQTCSEGNMPDSVMDVDGIECNGKGRHRIEKLKVPPFALPAQVWRDIREANERDNPALFLDEVDEMDM